MILYCTQVKKGVCVVLFSFVFVCVAVAVFFVFGLWVEDSGNETSIIVDGSCSDQCKNPTGRTWGCFCETRDH